MQINAHIKSLSGIAIFIIAMLFSCATYGQIPDSLKVADPIKSTDTAGADVTDSVRMSARQLRKAERERKRALKDSLKSLKPLILTTYALPDSLKVRRLISWKQDPYFNNISMLNPDTTYNENFQDLPQYRKDAGATYLGVSGSAAQYHNYFLREDNRYFKAAAPYALYSFYPENLPFYNVKTPVTELGYSGTLLASRLTEESNVRFMHTQNISPEFNFNIHYKRYGAKGLLLNEETDNRNLAISTNYLGKKYLMHSGYIYQGIKRGENGGVTDDKIILDTLVDPRTISVTFSEAKNVFKRNTFFINQSYGIRLLKSKDTTDKDAGTVAYLGHSSEYTTYRRVYTDKISSSDLDAVKFYDNKFYINPSSSYDSTRVSIFENKAYIRLRPWADDAIISRIEGGAGYQSIKVFSNKPEFENNPAVNDSYNNLFLYAGASGKFRKYFGWEGFGKYSPAGYFANDFLFEGKVRISLYPIKEGIHLSGKISLENAEPNWYEKSIYSNHYKWDNSFGKTTTSRIEGNLDIPSFKLRLFAGYELVTNKIYYDTLGVVRQSGETVNILSAYLQKDIKLGAFHMNNRILAQISSNDTIVPLPLISANLRYFFEFDLVKGVLRSQMGADATWNTRYYAPAWNPALSVFQLQNIREIGNTPYIDLFVNLQWKRASIFIKYENAFLGWPSSDYFSALHYIRPQSAIKFGIHWPFYVK